MAGDEGKFFFEGVEKVLEIDFAPGEGAPRGLRLLTREQLDALCTAARCTIISTMSNEHLDSYVLSESSLFVYSHKLILKTCGTTTLLMCLPLLVEYTLALGMRVEWVAYTRKDFQRPGQQQFPHRDPAEECTFLKRFFPEGDAYILGPLTGDHWVVYVADYVDRPTDACVDRTLDMMMFGIDDEVAKLFMKDTTRFPADKDVTMASGIDTLLPGSQIQEFCFDPCGYSMNGLLYDSYWTIHITPESHCSYASFETNIRMTNYAALIKSVLAIFRPRKWTMTLFADTAAVNGLKASPYQSLMTVPLVESTSKAIQGPCVITHDAHGNSYVVYDAANGSAGVSSPATDGRADRADSDSSSSCSCAGGVVASGPSSTSLAEGFHTAMTAKTAASLVEAPPTAEAAPTSKPASLTAVEESKASSLPSPPPPIAITVNTAAVAGGAGGDVGTPTAGTSSSFASGGATPVSLVHAIASLGSRTPTTRAVSAPGVVTKGKGTMSYLMSTKCQTEFVGAYSAMMGNFTLIHAAPAGTTMRDMTAVAEAAKEALSLPRAKYVVAKGHISAADRKLRTRTESI